MRPLTPAKPSHWSALAAAACLTVAACVSHGGDSASLFVSTDGPTTGVVRWARTGADGTLAWIDPAEAARGPPGASPLAGPVRVRSDARRPLDPGTLVLLPASAARAARLGPAAGDPRGAPGVGRRGRDG